MTVLIEKPAFRLREALSALKGLGGYQEQQFYFDKLVTNGTFDAGAAGYTQVLNGTISYASNSMLATGTTGNTGVYQDVSCGVGVFQVSWDQVSGTNFRINIYDGASFTTSRYNNGTGNSSTGSFAENVVCTSGILRVYPHTATGYTAEFDNISIFETDGTDVIHTMPYGWKPKDVFEDGLLQREGAAHDYEVVYDGLDYKIKPTVAPSATTETCVIGVKA